MDTKGKIFKGPDYLRPIPDETAGEYFYRQLITNNKQYEAIVDAESGKSITFLDLLINSCKLAQSLGRSGYVPGDVLSICSENSIYFFEPVLAAFMLGCPIAPINQIYSKGELLHTLNISKPKLIFCSNATYNKFLNIQPMVPFLKTIVVFDLKEKVLNVIDYHTFVETRCDKYFNINIFKPTKVDPYNHAAAILCSSGTTGLPKGVMITHRNIVVKMEHRSDERFYVIRNKSTCVGLLPFFHSFGFMTSLENLTVGQRMIAIGRYSEELLLRSIEKYKVSCLWVVPAVMIILEKSPNIEKYDLSSVVELGCGAAPLSKNTEITVQKRLPNLERFIQGYGLTEVTFAATITPRGIGKRGSSGKLLARVVAKVWDPETGKTLGPNQVGELCFKGDILMKGYFGNEDATKATINNEGWLLSGDLGYFDDDEEIFIVDRLKELIKYKGFQVAPAELEAILLKNLKIKDAGVIGVPDEFAGELPMAFVVKQKGVQLTEDEVKIYVANQLSKQKHLHGGVKFIEAIPRNASGKILRRELRKLATTKHKL